ncbi:DUF5693 family protein [Halonatronum saccharophilum]|uniref:DUF5693 family protein n=1 Tax=Halonatronum saccharophilum TaxID=150060 RepID=UPI00047F7783|nr:DUF5693 family protein [Halonatronum saccharophilum]
MKRLVGIIIIIGLIASSFILIDRYKIESENRDVELIMDYALLEEEGQQHLLSELKEAGITSLAIEFLSLSDLKKSEKIGYYWGREVSFLNDLVADLESFADNNLYISGERRMLKELKLLFDQKVEEGELNLRDNLLVLSNFSEEVIDEEIYLDQDIIAEAKKLDLNLIPRLSYGISPLELENKLKELENLVSIIFKGDRVVGYPDQIDQVAYVLKDQKVSLGMIEPFIGHQRGISTLGEKMEFEVFRVHSGDIREFERLGIDRSIDRYFRAVNERNVRGLYLKPFLEEEDTLSFVSGLSERLKGGRYRLERANAFRPIYRNALFEVLISLALLAPLYLILARFHNKLRILIFLVPLAALAVYLLLGPRILLEAIALGGAIVYPLFTLAYLIDKVKGGYTIAKAYRLFWEGSLITLAGGLLLFSLLSNLGYILQIYHFRGVKVSFLLPLIFGLIYYLNLFYGGWRELSVSVNGFLEKHLLWRDLFIGLILAFGGLIYLTRTGNYPIIAASGVEIRIRDLLEKLFVIRPRFKTFLIGHPLLLIGVGLSLRDKKYLWVLLLGLIGQITILNTFSHLHTPLRVSLIRTFIELIIGSTIGILVLKLLDNAKIK